MNLCESGSIALRSARKAPRQAVALLGLAALLAPLPGCQSITGTPSVSQVRIVDASPDAPGLDVYQGTGILAYNLGLGTITSYVPITPGSYNINVDIAGSHQQLLTQSGAFANNNQYTVLIGDYSAGYEEIILKDQSQAAPSGQIALRIIDQSTRAGAVDLYFVPTGSTVVMVKPFLTGVIFGTNTGYINVPNGTYTLVAMPAGVAPTLTGSTFYTGASVAYGSGTAKTIILIDQQLITTPGVQVITANDYESPSATM